MAQEKIYCATEKGLYFFDTSDNSLNRLSKINGLSDIGFSSIAYSESTNSLVIAYTNTNIDILQDNTIINLPDIKNKQILGNKTINDIHIDGDFAYLACGFGIVVLDLLKHEVYDTYYIGDGGTQLDVQDITNTSTSIIAASENGVYKAPRDSEFLANFEIWEVDTNLPAGIYESITAVDERVYVSRDAEADSIYWTDGAGWTNLDDTLHWDVRSLETAQGYLMIAGESITQAVDVNGDNVRRFGLYRNNDTPVKANHAVMDDNGDMWIADRDQALMKVEPNYLGERKGINGPLSISAIDIGIWDSKIYVASGNVTSSYGNRFNAEGVFTFIDEQWGALNAGSQPALAGTWDYMRVAVDPQDSRRVFATTWGKGVVEFYDNEVVARYDSSNSAIQPLAGLSDVFRMFGLAYDNDGNVWVTSDQSNELLYCKTPAGDWYGYNFSTVTGNITFSDLVIDDIGQKWIVLPRGVGMCVFNDNGTLANTGDDQAMKLTQGIGNGNLPSNDVFSVARDFDGEIWVGTSNGISVFYSPESAFTGQDFDSQQILVEQDGYVQYLLENEAVNDIAVDGANRKWIATANAGVFLMSEDGTEEIEHFTEDNSPLFTNNVISIGIDHLSGEVYFGTEDGMLSYRGTATYGGGTFDDYDVVAFPNPVTDDYQGPIAIKGLVTNADVKIADVSGNVVYATTAEGGQAIWDGYNLSGQRAKTGVYLVFASNEDGKEACVTKILLVN